MFKAKTFITIVDGISFWNDPLLLLPRAKVRPTVVVPLSVIVQTCH